jgi:hypothetical protein
MTHPLAQLFLSLGLSSLCYSEGTNLLYKFFFLFPFDVKIDAELSLNESHHLRECLLTVLNTSSVTTMLDIAPWDASAATFQDFGSH